MSKTIDEIIAYFKERFWSNVDKSKDCWTWKGCKSRFGYGEFYANKKTYRAHRLAYELSHGDIPDGLFVLHRCDNPTCVNPDHLFVGTHSDNMKDAANKGRICGEMNSFSKLTWNEVNEIRRLYSLRVYSMGSIARKFGVSKASISNIVKNKLWRRYLANAVESNSNDVMQ